MAFLDDDEELQGGKEGRRRAGRLVRGGDDDAPADREERRGFDDADPFADEPAPFDDSGGTGAFDDFSGFDPEPADEPDPEPEPEASGPPPPERPRRGTPDRLERRERPNRPARPARGPGPPRRGQQFMLRRLIGVGVGLLFLILFVFAMRGCLEARSDRGLRNYTQEVAAIMQESQVRGEEFFEAFESGDLTDEQLEDRISSIRSAASGQYSRAESIEAPDQMRDAQGATIQALRLRRDALEKITNSIEGATADANETTAPAIDVVTEAMGSFYASDILWQQLAVPEITQVVKDDGVDGADLPDGNFMPANDPTRFLDEQEIVQIITSLGGADPSSGGARGLELVQVNLGDTTLDPETTTTVADDAREISVQVTNGGEETERAVEVEVTFGDEDLAEPIPQIEAGSTEEANIPLQTIPQPGTEIQITVLVQPVEGEVDSSNNEATYTVLFGDG